MLDRSIPFYNVIMKCERYVPSEIVLPPGFHWKVYEPGAEKAWAAMEYEIGDFDTPQEAEDYFLATYCADVEELRNRCVFVADARGQIVGACIAWRDRRGEGTVASLHWLVVAPSFQGRGLGKALCQRTMELFQSLGELPVYVHTQPWSHKAIVLYIRQGFQLQTRDTFSHYENQYPLAMQTLKGVLPPERYRLLEEHSV